MNNRKNLQTKNSVWLSICITTRNREKYLAETLASFLCEMNNAPVGVELVIVDGASDDNTRVNMRKLVLHDSIVRYIRQEINGGLDRDFDQSVIHAFGEYCWLCSDDDNVIPGALIRIYQALKSKPSLLVVDAEVRSQDLKFCLTKSRLNINESFYLGPENESQLFLTCVDHLSFIAAVIVERQLWISRERETYFGSYFLHVGVIFQAPLPRGALILSSPCLSIRYGNASWTTKSFYIWMISWPHLLWSFSRISDDTKNQVIPREPWRSYKRLFAFRAKGAYSLWEYNDKILPQLINKEYLIFAKLIAYIPGLVANFSLLLYAHIFVKNNGVILTDLRDSRFYYKTYFANLLNLRL